ncbi:MAG: type II secretion system protein, partial [Chloroflexi bacterium]|nr:type II secretion system protein [Chloroflexota bacterium]
MRLWRRQKGFTLLELVVGVALFSIATTSFVGVLAGGAKATVSTNDKTSAVIAVTTQLEDTLAEAYVEPPIYREVLVPEGLAVDSDNSVDEPTLKQTIKVDVATIEKDILSISTTKVNQEFVASPPILLFSQRDYQWLENADATAPGEALEPENTPVSLQDLGQVFRLRLSVQTPQLSISAGQQSFKLQYSNTTLGPWTDLGNPGSAETWRGFNNPSAVDGATLNSTLLSTSTVVESYEEQNPTIANPNATPQDSFAEWDWVIQENNAPFNEVFFFRLVEADGTELGSYTRFPVLIMPAPQALVQFDYRWFGNRDDISPLAKVDQQHVPIKPKEHGLPFRLRMNVGADGLNFDPGDLTLKLQYATATDGPFTDVGPLGSAETWRFFDNPSVASEAVLPRLLLTTSSVLQTYQEANPAIANPNPIGVSQRAEWDWSLEDNFAPDETTFFFRVVKADGTLLDTYTFFPELTTAPAPLLNQRDY